MAQVNWIFLDAQGGRHKVGLFHGDRSGHVLLHCNRSIVQIDFSIKESKTYTFFIEEELVEIHLRLEPNGFFSYEFVLNETADTPRNRIRKVLQKRDLRYIGYTVAGMAIFALALIVFGQIQERRRISETSLASQAEVPPELSAFGRNSTAHIVIFGDEGSRKARYSFQIADSSTVSGLIRLPDQDETLLPTGFPLANGDAFSVLYLPDNPKVHRIDFHLPERSTVVRYVRLALDAEVRLHPQRSAEKAMCFLQTVLDQKGWKHLASVIHQTKTQKQNPQHNSDTYSLLLHDPAVMTVVDKECWDK
jgi:hypothetical protein